MLEVVVEKQVFKIKITAGAKQVVANIAKRNDMTQEGVAGRIYQWFSEQPAILQRLILGHIDDELKADALKKIAVHFGRQVPFSGDGTPTPTEEPAEEQGDQDQRRKRKSSG